MKRCEGCGCHVLEFRRLCVNCELRNIAQVERDSAYRATYTQHSEEKPERSFAFACWVIGVLIGLALGALVQ